MKEYMALLAKLDALPDFWGEEAEALRKSMHPLWNAMTLDERARCWEIATSGQEPS